MNKIEKAIRDNFPGKDNAGLRAMIREAAEKGTFAISAVADKIALNISGKLGLKAVRDAASEEQKGTKQKLGSLTHYEVSCPGCRKAIQAGKPRLGNTVSAITCECGHTFRLRWNPAKKKASVLQN